MYYKNQNGKITPFRIICVLYSIVSYIQTIFANIMFVIKDWLFLLCFVKYYNFEVYFNERPVIYNYKDDLKKKKKHIWAYCNV